MKDKASKYFLIVSSNKKINTGELRKMVKAKKALRSTSSDVLMELLGVEAGSVTPLGLLADKEKKVTVVLDSELETSGKDIMVHPLTNAATLSLSFKSLMLFLEKTGHAPDNVKIMDVPEKTDDQKPQKTQKPQKPQKPQKKKNQAKNPKPNTANKGGKQVKKITKLGLSVKKTEDFAEWYSQVVVRAEMIEYYDVSGCYILRPWSFAIWDQIKAFLDAEIKKLGITNAYFPLFISKANLHKEEDHVAGFVPEVAWVTKSGKTDLAQPIAVRPTSETVMYPAYSKWIQNYRDLPLKINQWCNVVRWEFSCPTPFIRSREFLWQEGHCVHATKEEAEVEVLDILELYAQVYEDLLCIPVIKGKKTEKEKFAGGYYTTTVEAFVAATGRAIQGATSHCLGQNFAKMFNISFQDEKNQKRIPWQTSWGLTTRTIGVMVMVHGDDKGLVLPPRVAPTQVVIIPIPPPNKKDDNEWNKKRDEIVQFCKKVENELVQCGLRVFTDDSDNNTPSWKYNHWELKGVPLRVEIGPRDMSKQQVTVVRREQINEKNSKVSIARDGVGQQVTKILISMQADMLRKATVKRDSLIQKVTTWDEFMKVLDQGKFPLAPWCGTVESEEKIKFLSAEASGGDEVLAEGETTMKLSGAAKSLCLPFDQPELPNGTKCVITGKPAIAWCLYGRSY